MGGTNLTNINYSTIGNVKFIDKMNYYWEISINNDKKRKNNAEFLVKQFLMQHQVF